MLDFTHRALVCVIAVLAVIFIIMNLYAVLVTAAICIGVSALGIIALCVRRRVGSLFKVRFRPS